MPGSGVVNGGNASNSLVMVDGTDAVMGEEGAREHKRPARRVRHRLPRVRRRASRM